MFGAVTTFASALRESVSTFAPIVWQVAPRACASTALRKIERQEPQPLKPFDGNQAASYVAYHMSDNMMIYPITPSSPMGEYADEMEAEGVRNVFGNVSKITQLQSEGGAAGALHGSAAVGSLSSTFTASQGLLLMVPNLYKMAGELLPSVIHVAARALSFQALSIFGDHSDVMATRQTGCALLAGSTVQEAMDLALVSHLATIKSRVPFIHFFDGFRISHEINSIEPILPRTMKALLDEEALREYRCLANLPERPKALGHSQGPDAIFQTMEAANPYHDAVPQITQDIMDDVYEAVGRRYNLFEYSGDSDAEDVVVVMGSGAKVVEEAVAHLQSQGRKVGVLNVRMYRPWSAEHFMAAVPKTVKNISVLDRTKEPGSQAEPLFQDVVFSMQQKGRTDVMITGGRYGLASKEFNPTNAVSVFDNMRSEEPKNHFTIGINDDVTHLNLTDGDAVRLVDGSKTKQCMFWGMGSDGTVGANKTAVKMIIDNEGKYSQAYFSYSADKSNALTRSYVRVGDEPITHEYLIEDADYVACMKPMFVTKFNPLGNIKNGGTFVLNTADTDLESLDRMLPGHVKRTLAERNVEFYVIDATNVANAAGIRGKTSTIMQTVFFKLTGLLGQEERFMPLLKDNTVKSFRRLGDDVVNKNMTAIENTLDNLRHIEIPAEWANAPDTPPVEGATVPDHAPKEVHDVVLPVMLQKGGSLPVSKYSEVCLGGVCPLGTTHWERKNIADVFPVWDSESCAQCNVCTFQCPHSSIRPFVMTEEQAEEQDLEVASFKPVSLKRSTAKAMKGMQYRIQVSPQDCTSCGLCVSSCPHGALEFSTLEEDGEEEISNWRYCMELPKVGDAFLDEKSSLRGLQFISPLLEFPGSCAGCTETAVTALVSKVAGERMTAANSSGCSSVWAGCFPRMPFVKADSGRGTAWGRSLFEDAAEYGYGMAVATQTRREGLLNKVSDIMRESKSELPAELAEDLTEWMGAFNEGDHSLQLTDRILPKLYSCEHPALDSIKGEDNDDLWMKKSHWIIGGDGWAYDIGYGGLDHVLSTGEDVNVLVFDNEVYANTGAQKSKATQRGASAKFAITGKETPKKDLGAMAMTYDNVFVANLATATRKQMQMSQDAVVAGEAFNGPSLLMFYCNCEQHHIKGGMGSGSLRAMKLAVDSGYWPLYTWDPRRRDGGVNPFQLESEPNFELLDQYLATQGRFGVRANVYPDLPDLWPELKNDIKRRWDYYNKLACDSC